MVNPIDSQIHIFLIQPLSKDKYKEIIVYADTEQQARAAAALVNNPEKVRGQLNEFSAETTYQDRGMSICIEIKPDIIKLVNNLEMAKIIYNEVVYDLNKGQAQEVIAENIL